MSEDRTISHRVVIADQAFRVRIHPDEIEYYDKIARHAEGVIRELRAQQGGANSNASQAWAMTAFQIAIELFETRAELTAFQGAKDRIERISERLARVLEQG